MPGLFGPMGGQGNPGPPGGQGRQGVQGVEGPSGLKGSPGTGISHYILSIGNNGYPYNMYPLIEMDENEIELNVEQIDEDFHLSFTTMKQFYYIQFLIYDTLSVIFYYRHYHEDESNTVIITDKLSSYLIHITIKWK